ncbi:hypothetical protein A3C57_01870 [Candidatus Nomurabacteria bacterium RIFCSPHIGHO2_02_FULL_33_12]|uniref:RecF/RecN/SMC N-terminal domain-containing protein n=1 Tax=Candidatus Nomurabacteria bacterium RIFCSPLOWO2_01_FULL_33_17 TaxID=1801764 RepID=A0A1F6WN76_9BACT|nr:MAG: hypothetical protein A3C57_01870 [Candidatus Nomurabacteria bacterium RIFCSPHIGHO2_02_FULL_33_12]OGI83266.1 MAG: hypothetical protein A2903_02730 [Candidatus Nomurabacteria bacterium RIFCSPLOWO2_01_FULL_33_17]
MTLRTLEINGFKSFGKKSSISVDAPITAIVGPNGSGKSNVVEAMRFVLGEQSMKSLRGKGTSDLLFKGSKLSNAVNKLKVEIFFDNKKRKLSLSNDIGKNISLDFDTVSIAREFYADGHSVYSIQGSEVRLKDVTDLLASVHIGSSGHHIISQGQADRLLTASAKERRAMIDDALGLRIYEIRIRDSMRKLEKSKINISEIMSARRELAPHLNFLRKQVEKLNEAEEARRELSRRYFHYEKSTRSIVSTRHDLLNKELFNIETELTLYKNTDESPEPALENNEISSIKESIERINAEKSVLLRTRESLERQLGRTEGLIEAFRKPHVSNNSVDQDVVISREKFIRFCEEINNELENVINNPTTDFHLISTSLRELGKKVKSFLDNYKGVSGNTQDKIEKPINSLSDNNEELNQALQLEDSLKKEIEKNIESVRLLDVDEKLQLKTLQDKEIQIRSSEAEKYKARVEKTRLLGEKSKVESDLERILQDKMLMDEEKKLFEPFLINSLDHAETDAPLGKEALVIERRALERLRLKLEDIGGGSGGDIIAEFETTKERDEYLSKELADLNNSIESLLKLISDLRETVRLEFSKGIDKINVFFAEFFKLMFGGGNAFLSLVSELKKDIKLEIDSLDDESLDDDEEESLLPKFERGVNIHVDLPNKKVKELTMLSGGERSLVSIALLFAISQVNPPPFLVLDETDAALDEANSRRYGDMLEKLSSHTQLIVVTHNRETMSRAGTIYGVTMNSDSVSKLLSIEFADATKIAK